MPSPEEVRSTRKGGEGRNILGTDEFRSGITKMNTFLTARVINPMPEKAQFRPQHSITMVVGDLTEQQHGTNQCMQLNTKSRMRTARNIYINSFI